MWAFWTVLIVILIVILIGFAVFNAQEMVTVDLFFSKYINIPMIVVAYMAFTFGVLISFLLFVSIYFRQISDIRKFKRLADSLSSEISALRNRPIEEASDSFILSEKDENK
ncbi:MAG: LapA family protein [candidate division Zixibacteria bacterium]